MKKIKKKTVVIVSFVLVISLVMLSCYEFFFGSWRKYEYKTDLKLTNETPVMYHTDDELLKALSTAHYELSEFLRQDLKESDLKNKKLTAYPIIPGLEATKTVDAKTGKPEMCTTMTPQGLAVCEKYIFISAYCSAKKHNSVIYMLDRISGKFIKEIVLQSKSHVGGLAFDTKNNVLWVSEHHNRKGAVASFSLEKLENYDSTNETSVLKYDHLVELEKMKRSSFITYVNDTIIAGYFNLLDESYFRFYDIDDNGVVKPKSYFSRKISNAVQSIAYGNDCIVLTESYGIYKSRILVYDNITLSDENRQFRDKDATETYEFPQKLEQVYFYGDRIYLLFESGAFSYRYVGTDGIDRLISMKCEGND